MFHGIVRSRIRRILILIFIIRRSQEENSANGEQITESETDNYINENKGDAATTVGTDILTEGQPGWMEKLLKKAKKKVKVSLR